MKIGRIYRLLRLITMLQRNRAHSIEDLADGLDVSRRTVFRDLKVLEMARIPYYHDRDQGGYRINPMFFLPPVNLTLTEALAVLALTGRLRASANVPLQAAAARAATKLESVLPPQIGEYVGNVLDRLSVHLPAAVTDSGDAERYLEALAGAIVGRQRCTMTYKSLYDGKTIDLTVRPLRLTFIERAWYVIAHSEMHDETRTFKLIRIDSLAVTEETFDTPADPVGDEPFGDAWRMIPEGKLHDVRLHFEPKVAANVAEVQWHHSQKVDWNDDGSIEFRATVDGLGELTWWLLGYGDQVTVMDPPELRQRVVAVAGNVVAKYDESGSES